jgi:hypothetical protein
MVGTGLHFWIPTYLRIQVGMQINKTRRHDFTLGINFSARVNARQIANAGNSLTINGDIRADGFTAGTINNRCAANNCIV